MSELNWSAKDLAKLKRKPTWVITFGKSKRVYYTEYHALQFARALRAEGTTFELEYKKGG